MPNYFYGFNIGADEIKPKPLCEIAGLPWARRAYLEVIREEVETYLEQYPGVRIGHLNTLGPNQIL